MGHSDLPMIYLARHGETAWSLTGQHTGLTDLPLTESGERNAQRLRARLSALAFDKVFTSPLQRARRTCELAGFGSVAEIVPDLVEWNYGDYEGRRSVEIRAERPDWQLFRDGCPGGESPQQVAARADRVVDLVRTVSGNVLLFSSGHFLRMLAVRWSRVEPIINARPFMLDTASLSALGYEKDLSQPAIRLWNDTHHLRTSKEHETDANSLLSTESRQ
jgi:broad specificity phosphatase PhoE